VIDNNLVLIKELDEKENHRSMGLYLCKLCKREVKLPITRVETNHIKTCGCLRGKHGLRYTPEYEIWKGMKHRCNNKNNSHYKYYGGRGIKVCERWKKFINFWEDIGQRPSNEYSIHRKDNDGHYEPENCIWATDEEQIDEKSNTVWVIFNGENTKVKDLAKRFDIDNNIVRGRLKKGWSLEKSLTTPHNTRFKYIEFNGQTLTITQWSKKYNIKKVTLCNRLRKGWDFEKAVTTPIRGIK